MSEHSDPQPSTPGQNGHAPLPPGDAPKTQLRHLRGNVYEDVNGGMEPVFEFLTDRGEVQFWHQSGYGYLPASRVEVVPHPAERSADHLEG